MNNTTPVQTFFNDQVTLELARELTLERIKVMPESLRMAVGSMEFDKEDLTKHVRDQDDIGKQIMEMNVEFLRDLASGAVYAR